ncbi:MAG: hypothetical protein IJG16_09265, partial [Clostridia bacterium]|nr:hypothetical protein [Clostridia bacterium]
MKKIISAFLAASMLTGSIAAFAADFDIGAKFTDTENAAAKAQTQKLFDARPHNLKQAEDLSRGLVAVPSGDGILVSWRYLGTDSASAHAEISRNGEYIADVYDTTNYFDANGKSGDKYSIIMFRGNTDVGFEEGECVAWDKEYLSIPVVKYDKGDYIVDDASVGDLDGDGEYEYIVRRTPADYFNKLNVDESGKVIDTRDAYPLVEAYELDGTHLWTLN